MTRIGIAVVSHVRRRDMAFDLADKVGANALFEDSTGIGCEANHRRAWDWHNERRQSINWAVVLEDDAEPVDGFNDQLVAALTVAPAPIVSLYLGTSRPPQWQQRIVTAAQAANDTGATWITAHNLLHAVGVAVHTDLLDDMCTAVATMRRPIDESITAWAMTNQHPVAYTWPSLVDHHDGPTLIAHHDGAPRTQARRAWQHGSRDQWTTRTVEL